MEEISREYYLAGAGLKPTADLQPIYDRHQAIIGPETRLIEEYLDNMLREAGIRPDDIDVVIRTGGSSQIPVFVQMLESRFGADKVRGGRDRRAATAGQFQVVGAGESEVPGDVLEGARIHTKLVERINHSLFHPDPDGSAVLPVDGRKLHLHSDWTGETFE